MHLHLPNYPRLAARTICPQSWLLDAIGQSSTKLIFRAPWVVGMVDVVVTSHDGSMGIMLAWYMKIYMENHTLSRHMLVNMPCVLWGWLVMMGVSLRHSGKLTKTWTQQMEVLEHDWFLFSVGWFLGASRSFSRVRPKKKHVPSLKLTNYSTCQVARGPKTKGSTSNSSIFRQMSLV